jgi:acid phosphatase
MMVRYLNIKPLAVPVHTRRSGFVMILLSIWVCLTTSAFATNPGNAERGATSIIPRPDHVIIVIEENKSYEQIIGNRKAPYINKLFAAGALFTQSFGVAHPSQPNYLALFSGSTHDIKSNECPLQLSGANLASELIRKGLTFGSYSESMPATGYTGCSAERYDYARKHNPAVNWQGNNLTPAVNMTFNEFPRDYTKLPTVSIVIPNMINDMHDGLNQDDAIKQGDTWLKNNLDSYVQWAMKNNSLLILTWDEDDNSSNNHIPTIFAGPMVKPGRYDNRIDHYSVLRTLVEIYGLSLPGNTITAQPIQNIWVMGKESDSQ